MTVSHWPLHPLKRIIDIACALSAIVLFAPLVIAATIVVFVSDGRSPLYISPRVGLRGQKFQLLKLRTMIADAPSTGIDTTIAGDPRITRVGYWLRRTKIDELPQFLNVLWGDMSIIGPRPNVERETQRYTETERVLLSIRPGLTDYASIVFADLAEALPGGVDPNLSYNQYVRPVKSRLALHYVSTASFMSDVRLFLLTVRQFGSRARALEGVVALLSDTGADDEILAHARRDQPLVPLAPPGADRVVAASDLKSGPELSS